MAYYDICPRCGCNLDPGERCDCEDEKEKQKDFFAQHIKMSPMTGQYSFFWEGKDTDYAKKAVC